MTVLRCLHGENLWGGGSSLTASKVIVFKVRASLQMSTLQRVLRLPRI